MSTTSFLHQITIYGEPASKANSRQLVYSRGKPMFIKSMKARNYVKAFGGQCNKINPLVTEDVCVAMTIYYASRRPDLDESVILDCLQGFWIKNDRQVKKKIIMWGLDRENPRAEIVMTPLEISDEES